MKKTVVSGQVSLANNTDVHVSRQAPPFPIVGQMWLDITTEPPILKKYDGQTWIKTTMDIEHLDPIKYNSILSGIAIAQESADGKTTNYYGYIAPTKAKNGDMWFQYNEAGTVCTGLFVWNNGAWIKKELDAQALSVDKLSALSADLGNVTAGNITGVKITGSEFTTALSDGITNTTIKEGGVTAKGNLERYFKLSDIDTAEVRRYPVTAELTSGFLRFTATDKLKDSNGNWVSVLGSAAQRRLYFSEKGISTAQNALSSLYNTSSRFIDFYANEGKEASGFTGSGMKIYSGQQLEASALGKLDLSGDSISISTLLNGKGITVAASETLSLVGGFLSAMATLSKTGISFSTKQDALEILNSSTYPDQIYVQSLSLYNRTTSSAANMYVSTSGILARATSARKYKINIDAIPNIEEKAKNVLAIEPKRWNDKQRCECLADGLTNGTVDELDADVKVETYHGFIADDFHDAGLTEVVQYDENGEVDALNYDRISMYHNVVLKEHDEKIAMQAKEIELLKLQIEKVNEILAKNQIK